MMEFLLAIIYFLFYLLVFLLAGAIVFVAISVLLGRGAVYVPADKKAVKKMIELLKVKPGEKAVDLGAGDGRIVIALARAGAEAHGYEINPFLVWLARRKIRQAGLARRAFIHGKSFWGKDLSGFDVVAVYGVSYVMPRLEKKLERESRGNTRIVSYIFEFSHWKSIQRERGVYLYKR